MLRLVVVILCGARMLVNGTSCAFHEPVLKVSRLGGSGNDTLTNNFKRSLSVQNRTSIFNISADHTGRSARTLLL